MKKYLEIQEMSLESLTKEIKNQYAALRKMRFAHAIAAIENPTRIRYARRYLAQLKTEERVKQIANKK